MGTGKKPGQMKSDEVARSLADCQVKFIGFILKPYFDNLHTLVPEMAIACEHCEVNRKRFAQIAAGEVGLLPATTSALDKTKYRSDTCFIGSCAVRHFPLELYGGCARARGLVCSRG